MFVRLRKASLAVVAVYLSSINCANAEVSAPVTPAVESTGEIPSATVNKSRLRLVLPQGKVFNQKIYVSSKECLTTGVVSGDFIQITYSTTAYDVRWEVVHTSEDGNMQLKATIQHVKLTTNGPGAKNFHYDSKEQKKTIDVRSARAAAMAGQSLIYTFAEDGDIFRIEGVDNLVDRYLTLAKIPEEERDVKAEKVRMDILAHRLGITVILADVPVGAGDTWQVGNGTRAGLQAHMQTTYTLKSRNQKFLEIQTTSVPDKENVGKTTFDYEDWTGIDPSSSARGTFKLDITTLWPRSVEMVQYTSGDRNIDTPPTGNVAYKLYATTTIRAWTK